MDVLILLLIPGCCQNGVLLILFGMSLILIKLGVCLVRGGVAQKRPRADVVLAGSSGQQVWGPMEPHDNAMLHVTPVLPPHDCAASSGHHTRLEGHQLLRQINALKCLDGHASSCACDIHWYIRSSCSF